MRRITGIAVAGLVLTGSLTACGKLDGPAGSIKEAASETTPSASTTADPDPSTSPSPSNTTRKPTSTSTTRRPTSASPTRGPITAADVPKLTVSELLAQARTAAESVRTVHVRATVKLDTEKLLIDMWVDRETEDFYGSVNFPTYASHMVRIGESVWTRLDERYWLSGEAGRQYTPQQAQLLATKYVRQTTADPDTADLVEGIIDVADPSYVLSGLSDRSTKLPVQTFEGWQVIPVRAANGDTGYLNAGLPVYPIRLVTGGPEPEADNYDKFNEPVTVEEPPAGDVVNADA